VDFLKVPGVIIITARGCSDKCNFCSAGAMFGTEYAMRSAGHIADEIEYCIERLGIKTLKIYEDAVTINKTHVLRLVEELYRRKIDLPWECVTKANTVDRELLRTIKGGGCYFEDMGAESGSKELLRTIHN
jgi:anaerobic magnesium-protoporphyrin IX monomethyl ester cyclase